MYNAQYTANRIKDTAKAKKIKLKVMLEKCGLGINTISHMAKGQALSSDSLYAIAEYLEVSTDYLLGRSEEPNGNKSYNFGNHNMALGDLNITNNGNNQKMVNLDKVSMELLNIFQRLNFNDKMKVMNLINDLDQK